MEATLNGPAQSEQQETFERSETAEDAVQATQESLDQVRDILFGNQARDTERRFGEVENRLASELDEFRDETRKALGTLQSFIKSELAALAERLTSESNQRQESAQQLAEELKNTRREAGESLQNTARTLSDEQKSASNKLADDLRNTAAGFEKRVAAFDQQHASADSEIRNQLLSQANTLRDELKQNHGELNAIIEKLAAELRNSKTDRAALANLFAEMAGKLQA